MKPWRTELIIAILIAALTLPWLSSLMAGFPVTTGNAPAFLFGAWLVLGLIWVVFTLFALGRLAFRWGREERRLNQGRCPHCDYPLRFNGTEYWCSECGYKHFLCVENASSTDSSASHAEQLKRDEGVE